MGMKKDKHKTKIPSLGDAVSEQLFERVFLPLTAFLILLHLLTMYVAPAYMWGVHFYHFFPAPIGWVLTLISLLILLPGVNQTLYRELETLMKKIKGWFGGGDENNTFLLLSILSLPIFWILRTRLHLLGDGYFRIRDLSAGKFHLQEWLDGVIHLVIYRVMRALISSWSPELTYSVVSILCGGIFVFLALKLSAHLGKTIIAKFLIFSFLVFSGSIQLFFGYVESYSILQVALLAYIWLAALYISGKTNIFPVFLVFLLSVGLHITSLIFLPSLIYLVTLRRKGKPRKRVSRSKTLSNAFIFAGLIVALTAVISWIIIVATGLEKAGKGIFILPLFGSESYPFGMFSLAHLSEFFNQLLLISPVGISLFVFFLFFKIKHRQFEDSFANFLILGTVLGLVYLFGFNFTLGSADWDLRSSPAPFLGLLGGYLFVKWGEKRLEGKKSYQEDPGKKNSYTGLRFKAWSLIFIWFGIFHTLPWVLINASHSKSVARYVMIQESDPHPVDETGYNLYKVARILRMADVPEEEEKLYLRALENDPYDTLSYFNLAAYYHTNDLYDEAISVLDTLLKVDPLYPKANWMKGNIYVKRHEYEKALPYLEKAYPILADNSDFLYELGAAYVGTDQPEKALDIGQQIIKLTPDYLDAYHILGLSYYSLGDLEKAAQAWEYIISRDPTDSVAMDNLQELREYLEKE
jgi:hypothetical protein